MVYNSKGPTLLSISFIGYNRKMDTMTKKQRSYCMSRIKSKDTKPEIIVRKALSSLGVKYRLHSKKLPGTPDIVIPKAKTAIFINGCFWHQHKGCKKIIIPKSNRGYWKNKLVRNVEKQKKDTAILRKNGWKVVKIWECEAKKEDKLKRKLKNLNA